MFNIFKNGFLVLGSIAAIYWSVTTPYSLPLLLCGGALVFAAGVLVEGVKVVLSKYIEFSDEEVE